MSGLWVASRAESSSENRRVSPKNGERDDHMRNCTVREQLARIQYIKLHLGDIEIRRKSKSAISRETTASPRLDYQIIRKVAVGIFLSSLIRSLKKSPGHILKLESGRSFPEEEESIAIVDEPSVKCFGQLFFFFTSSPLKFHPPRRA